MTAPGYEARAEAPLGWAWSSRDEHRVMLLALVAAVAIGLVFLVLPPEADVFHTVTHGLGFVAPTCGLTRGGLALLRGDLGTAWRYNPAIFVLAPAAAALVARFGLGVLSGRWLTLYVDIGRAGRILLVVLVVALWVNQQAHFDLLAR